MIPSQKYLHPQLGPVHIRALSTATRFTARWKTDGLHLTIPSDTTKEEYDRVMKEWTEKLLEIKPAPKAARYYVGYRFETDDWSFEIVEDKRLHSRSLRSEFIGNSVVNDTVRRFRVSAASDYDFASPEGDKTVERIVLNIAHFMAEKVLIPAAKEEAVRLGLTKRVSEWEVGRGKKRMGCCSAKGRISLSHVLMFLPCNLRRATITHELAHLTHFDHSPEFYALWDKYLGYSHTIARDRVACILHNTGF